MIPTPRAAAPLLLLLSLAACGGESGPSFEGRIDAATAEWAADETSVFVSNTLFLVFQNQAFGVPDPYLPFAKGMTAARPTAAQRALGILERMQRLTSTGRGRLDPAHRSRFEALMAAPLASQMVCAPVEEIGVDEDGFIIDADGDYIPDDYTADWGTGCTTLEATGVYTLSGKYRIRDTGTGFASYEFTATRLRSKLVIGEGEYLSTTLDGIETASFSADSAVHTMSVTWTWDDHFDFGTVKTVRNIDEESSYDPDAGQGFTLGGPLPAGLLTFSADYELLGSGNAPDIPGNFRFVLNTAPPMHYAPACASYITAGILEGLLNGDAGVGFSYQWTGCAPPTLGFFGVTE